ncbi:hypothetical protein DFJ77DRAFT_328679 [Powellomyces hirtus]|nr:hypothetical protein DFJ77DRAFT_328679 [Powellomyces hirtus]
MTCSSALQYTEESVKQCKELVGFLRKRSLLEMEYAKSLFKLAQGYQKTQNPEASGKEREREPESGRRSSNAGDRSGDALRAQLLQTSVWKCFYDYVDQMTKTAETHRNLALAMQNNVMEPFTILIKDMEVVKKVQVDKSVDHVRCLQDVYAGLKRAQEDYDALQYAANEAQQNHMRARMTAGTKDKEIEKLANRAAAASEKADAANEALQVFGEICKDSQEQYYGQMLPSLLENIKKRERERSGAVKKVLADTVFLDKTCREANVAAIESLTDRLKLIDLEGDSEEFAEAHMVDEPGQQGQQVSVAALLNPVKAGRMMVKRGDFVAGWKTRYFVLMEDGLLYCFDNEAAVKPREILSLPYSAVHHLDNSYFNRPHCLQIICLTRKGRQTYNLIAETASCKIEWMSVLRKHASCCIKGVIAREQTGLHPLPNEEDPGFTVTRSFQLSVMEAKDLKGSQGLSGLNPYCIALLDDVKQSRTSTKAGDAPFWGEDFEFQNICAHYTRLRLVVFNHSRLQRDTDLGYVSINLTAAKPSSRIEQWYPIRQLPRPNHTEVLAKGSIRVAFSLNVTELLPAEFYIHFVELVTEPTFTGIKMLGSVCGTQREAVAKLFISILMSKKMELQGLKTLLVDEIEATDSPNIIFRGNSMATKAVDQYMKVIGMGYLTDTIGLLVRQVYMAKDACEVDPTRVEHADALNRNWKKLKTLVEGFWEAISKSAHNCPKELKEVFSFVRESVSHKWDGADGIETSQPVQYAAISGFIFLRFFCPAILHPKLFNLIPDHPDAGTSRTFTLIAKVLQNLANLSDFGSKEPYMAECNGFISSNIGNMKAFIDGVSTAQGLDPSDTTSAPVEDPRPLPRKDVENLYLFFEAHIESLSEQGGSDRIVQDLIRECRMLEVAHEEFRGHGSVESMGISISSFTSAECLAGLNKPGDGLRKLTSGMAGVINNNKNMSNVSGPFFRSTLDRPPQISLTDFSTIRDGIVFRPGMDLEASFATSSKASGSLDDLHAILDSMDGSSMWSSSRAASSSLQSIRSSSPADTSRRPSIRSASPDDASRGEDSSGRSNVTSFRPFDPSRRPSDAGTMSPIPPERKGSRAVDMPSSSLQYGGPLTQSQSFERHPPIPPEPNARGHSRQKSGGGKGFIKSLMNVGGGGDREGSWIGSFGDRKRFGSASSISSKESTESYTMSRRESEDSRSKSRTSVEMPWPAQNNPIMEHANESIERPPGQSGYLMPGSGPYRRTSSDSRENFPIPPPPPMPDGPSNYSDSVSIGSDSGSIRSNRLRSMSMGNKVKSRLSVIWKNGAPGGKQS